MKKLITILLSLFLFQCDNGDDPNPSDPVQWNQLGLDGRIINQIKISGDEIFAATDMGLYHSSKSELDKWQLIGFDELEVNAIAIISADEILAALIDDDENLFMTSDGGDTWEPVENNFGGEAIEEINYLELDPDNDQIVYGAGTNVIAKSDDQGKNWTPLYGEWQAFGSGVDIVRINPLNDNIWAGGQGAIENGFLLKSENGGEDWEPWNELVENPTVVKEIVFNPENEGTVYIGFEGALLKTTNGGDDFNTIIDSDDNRFFFGIDLSDQDPEKVFTGGWLKRFDEPQPLILFYSPDGGTTWQEFENESEDFGGITEIHLIEENDQQKRFLIGLYKGGIYEVTIDNSELE